MYHGQLIRKLSNAIYKVSALISNRATSEKVRKQCVEVHGFSQLIKVHECQDTITVHHETCHPSTSELSEAEPILSSDGYYSPYEKSSGTVGDLLPRGDAHTKVTRVLVVCRFWSHLGCLGRKVTKYALSGVA